MYFGTYAGLNRFDGHNFKLYSNDENDSTSISDNRIRSICEEGPGVLLIGTRGGLNRFILDAEEFVAYKHDPEDKNSLANNVIFKVFKDSDGDIWVCTWGGGLDKVEKVDVKRNGIVSSSYNFIHHKPQEGKASISSLKVADIAEGEKGILWIATRTGLNKYDKKTKSFKEYKYEENNPKSISSNNVSSVSVDHKGNVWVGTWGGGLNLYDPLSDGFIRFQDSKDVPLGIGNGLLKALYCDNDGDIWVASWGSGLFKILPPEQPLASTLFPSDEKNINTYRFLENVNNPYDPNTISSNTIYSVYEDKTGVMWVGVNWGGINKFEKGSNRIKQVYQIKGGENTMVGNVVYSLHLDRDGSLWIGTEKGLNYYNTKTGKYELFEHIRGNKQSISSNIVYSIAEDKNGTLWLGTLHGLNKFNRKTKKFKRYYEDEENPGNTHIQHIFIDKDGILWIGNYGGGLFRFDPVSEQFKVYLNEPGNDRSLSDNIIWHIIEDDYNLWLGTANGGLNKFNKSTEKFTRFLYDPSDSNSINDNYVLSLYIDNSDNFWVGTPKGLNKLELNDKGEVVFIKKFDDIGPTNCNGIVEGSPGELWVTTSDGLFKLNIHTKDLIKYDLDDGLQNMEFSFNTIIKDSLTGNIFAGGVKGFNVFNPSKLKKNTIEPQVNIVKLEIFNKPVEVGQEINGRVILDKSISYLDELVLSYKEYVISFEISAMHFQSPKGNQYAYYLEGFESGWNYVKNKRSVTYTNLKPGKYTFYYNASNSDGVWNIMPGKLDLVIKPPFWQTLVFRIALVLIIVISIYFIYLYRVKSFKQNQRQLEENVVKRTEQLSMANKMLEEKQEEISSQNEELLIHRLNLEKLVEDRTSELQEALIKAEESDKLKSAFLANMSHEVRTPMNAIVGFSSMLNDEELPKDEKQFYIRMIKNSSDSLLTLIDDILDISRIEANQLVLHEEVFCIGEIFEELFKYYDMYNEKDIEIKYVKSNSKIYINNDSVRFRQVMNNLLNNAVKYTEEGYVEFGYEIDGKFVIVYVKDTGIGIKDVNFEKIFNYFQKIDNSVKIYEGTGIGLSVSKKLAELMGGDISLESKYNSGSTFYFRLPEVVRSEKSEKEAPMFLQLDLSHLKIILAEDENNNYLLAERILRNTKAEILWAQNGEEAVRLVKESRVEGDCIVVMDIKMPVMNGVEAKTHIKDLDKNIPVIAMTAYAQAGDKQRFLKEGFDNYISKPFNKDRLMKVLSKYSKNP
jgi:signal transduction histidine kinase/ligand-binding sensor domain-containing protein/CheY-like chemotaxis protein